MQKFIITDLETLLKAADIMHDTGFTKDDINYNAASKVFRISAKQYGYKGKFIQRQTDEVVGTCEMILDDVRNCIIIEKDKKGLDTLGEDYFNFVDSKTDSSFTIRTTFREIVVEVDRLKGTFEYEASTVK